MYGLEAQQSCGDWARRPQSIDDSREKLNHYFTRTIEHIHRVQQNALYLITRHAERLFLSAGDCRRLAWNVMRHDYSKFSEEQFWPYVDFTWAKKVGSGVDMQAFGRACNAHYMAETHHPERNNAAMMTRLDIIEMVCDLQAMAQEFNEGSCRKYFEEIWMHRNRQNFSDEASWSSTTEIMRQVIDCFELTIE